MIRLILSLSFLMSFNSSASAKPAAHASLLELCHSFGETSKECNCYLGEVKNIYSAADIELASGVARAFLNGEEPEAIAAYLLLTRKITITRANELYRQGDPHVKRIGQTCEDKTQKVNSDVKAKRNAMEARLEKIGARYRVGRWK